MNIKCGIDIIEIDRIKDNINNLGEKFINKIYTKKEIQYCESKKEQKYQHYAVRFAAKEAAFKAVSEALKNKFDLSWQDIEVLNNLEGRPAISISKIDSKFIKSIDISLSHCKQYAVANVVVLYE